MLRRLVGIAVVTAVSVPLFPLPATAADPVTLFTDDRVTATGAAQAVYADPAVTAAPPNGVQLAGLVSVTVAPPEGAQFTAGTAFPVGGTADVTQGSLAISDDGCDALTGSVAVADATYDGATLTSLAASYDAACAGDPGTRFSGAIRVASAVPYVATRLAVTGATLTHPQRPTVLTATLTNTGTAATSPAAPLLSGERASDYAVTADGCTGGTLQPGQACAVEVTFTPPAVGGRPASLSLPTTGHPRPAGSYAALAGRAKAAPQQPRVLGGYPSIGGAGLSWRAGTGDFLTYSVHRRPDPNAPWTEIGTPTTHSFVDPGLAVGDTAEYAVAMRDDVGDGPLSAPLSVTRGPDAVPGNGRALVVDGGPGTLASGRVDTARGGTITHTTADNALHGTGPSSLAVHVSLPRPPVGPGTYDVVYGNTAPGQVSMTAGTGSSGCALTGTLTVTEAAYAADASPQTFAGSFTGRCLQSEVPMYGEVRWDSATPYVHTALSPASVAVTAKVGETADQAVLVRSVGSGPATIGTPEVTGSADWSVVGNTCTAPVAPDTSCTVTVRFAPAERGARDAVLRVPDDTARGARLVALSGVGGSAPSAVPGFAAGGTLAGVALHWGEAPPNAYPVTEYRVHRSAGDTPVLLATLPATERAYADRTAVRGTTYGYSVTAVNAAGEGPAITAEAAVGRSQLVHTRAADRGSAPGLWAMPADGGPALPLSVIGGEHITPAVSPGGQWVAYAREAGLGYDLYVRRADGTGSARRLTSGSGLEVTPAWSPDGRTIAYTDVTTDGDISVRTVPFMGGTPTLRARDYVEPSWWIDNATLVAADYRSPTAPLVRIGRTGSVQPLKYTAGGFAPQVSPDGRHVAFSKEDGLRRAITAAVVRLDGSEPARAMPDYTRHHIAPTWRSDGAALYVQQGDDEGHTRIVRAPFDGTAPGAPEAMTPDLPDEELTPVHDDLGVRIFNRPLGTRTSAAFELGVADAPAGTTYTCKLDNAAAVPCTTLFKASKLAVGPHTLLVTASVPGSLPSVAAHRWIVDTTVPSAFVSAPPSIVTVSPRPLKWGATDTGTGVVEYDVRYRRAPRNGAFGSYVYPTRWLRTSANHGTLPMSPGYEYCVSARAHDGAGNVSPWSKESCAAMAIDDGKLTPAGGWARGSGSGYYNGTFLKSTTPGATLTLGSVTTRRVTVIADRCSSCGAVEVRVGGVLLGTLNLRSSTSERAVPLTLPPASVLRSGTLQLRTVNGGLVRIDGVGLRRT